MVDFSIKNHKTNSVNQDINSTNLLRDTRGSGVATLNIICDSLKSCDIISRPEIPGRKFSWAIAPSRGGDFSPFPTKETIYILSPSNYADALKKRPGSVGILALMPQDDIPADTNDEPLKNRLITIKPKNPNTTETPMELLSFLQSFFFSLYTWRESMSSLIDSRASVQELLDVSLPYLNGFVDVSDATFNLIAATPNATPPDSVSAQLIQNGTHSKELIERISKNGVMESWSSQNEVKVFEPFDRIPFTYVTKVMWKGRDYLGHVVMVCDKEEPTAGAVDLFETFADAACRLVAQTSSIVQEGNYSNINPAVTLITTLLNGAALKSGQLDKQLEILELDKDTEFRVVIVESQKYDLSGNAAYIASELNAKFPSRYFMAFAYEGYAFGLLHGKEWNGDYETRDSQILRDFCQSNGCYGYVSDRFHHIQNIRNAYKQTLLTAHYRDLINTELLPLNEAEPPSVYFFEDAFVFYLFGEHMNDDSISDWLEDNSFREFCMRNSVVDSMAAKAAPGETNDIKLLYYYLFYERKATPTANALHMHRNNILYRISSIEKRYALDLSRNETRLRLQTCFLFKILSSKSFRELIGS
jgi:hypothetical protein